MDVVWVDCALGVLRGGFVINRFKPDPKNLTIGIDLIKVIGNLRMTAISGSSLNDYLSIIKIDLKIQRVSITVKSQ